MRHATEIEETALFESLVHPQHNSNEQCIAGTWLRNDLVESCQDVQFPVLHSEIATETENIQLMRG